MQDIKMFFSYGVLYAESLQWVYKLILKLF